MKKIVYIALLVAGIFLGSCNYLDVIPDNITTIEMAFNNRVNARKYLATCYNFLPATYDMGNNNPYYFFSFAERLVKYSVVRCILPTMNIGGWRYSPFICTGFSYTIHRDKGEYIL